MAAVFNFLGVLVMTMINANVATTIYNMVDFGGNTHEALVALCAALFAIVVWATAGLVVRDPHQRKPRADRRPFRRRHRAARRPCTASTASEWIKVIYGLVLSTFLGFCAGLSSRRS